MATDSLIFSGGGDARFDSDLNLLIQEMDKFEAATHEIFTNQENEVERIYFQDRHMKNNFANWPDLIMFDATYKLNDRRMPLGIMMVIDGDGESQIAAVFIMKTESSDTMNRLFTKFKAENKSYEKIEIIMTDKSAANLRSFSSSFPKAQCHLCVFHVLQIFEREITTVKRNITTEQRAKAIEILRNMVYSKTENDYNMSYNELLNLNCNGNCEFFLFGIFYV